MNNTKIYLAILLFCLTVITACTKVDNTYRDYNTQAGSFNGTALQYLQAQPNSYDSMLLVINRLSGMANEISTGNLTVFAINNRSFTLALQNINQARRDSVPAMQPVSLSTIDSTTLETFFTRYIVMGRQSSDSLKGFTDGRFFTSIRYNYDMQMQFSQINASGYVGGGPKAIIYSDPKRSIFTRNWVRVYTITVDVKTSNAVVHLLPADHDFGFGSDFVRAVNRR